MIEFCEENPEGTYEDLLNSIEVSILFLYIMEGSHVGKFAYTEDDLEFSGRGLL